VTETLPGDVPDDVDAGVMRVLKSACEQETMIATAESSTGGVDAVPGREVVPAQQGMKPC
jgi:nicotinamide-nucleotide amidase